MTKSDKKIFATLFFSLLTTIMGVGIVVPLLPVYAHTLGARGIYIALIFASFSISRTFLLPYFGRRSDRDGRKPFIVTGLLIYALISVAFIFADTVALLITLRFLQGIASAMIMPVVQAYIGDITPPNREGTTMGIFSMSIFFGLTIGPLLGGFIHDYFGLTVSFLCMGVLSLSGFLLSLILLPPVKTERVMSRRINMVKWMTLLKDPDIIGLFAFKFSLTACVGTIWSFLPVFADTEFSLSSSATGILVVLGVFTSGLMQTPAGYVSDKINKHAMIIIGGLLAGYAMFSFEWTKDFWDLFWANALCGIGSGIATAPHTAISVKKGSKSGAMGSVMGLMVMAHSMGMLTGSLSSGVIMDFARLRLAFSFGALTMLFGVVSFVLCCCRKKIPVTPDHTKEDHTWHST